MNAPECQIIGVREWGKDRPSVVVRDVDALPAEPDEPTVITDHEESAFRWVGYG